ncbi:MAG: ABC transporter permease, partial [Chloroflexi bacterium]|nr:ABC transporter permease [Chloroflexota bacterium]
ISYVLYVIVGQYFIGKELRLAPIMGYASGLAAARFIVMPVIISTLSGLGGGVRFYRTVMLEEMQQDYVRTARAKGVSEQGVLYRHILKNAMIPVLTSVIIAIPGLFLGALLMESYFGIPGLGSVTFEAINSFDFSVVRVMVFVGALVYIIGTILTDITYTLVDPRVRLS